MGEADEEGLARVRNVLGHRHDELLDADAIRLRQQGGDPPQGQVAAGGHVPHLARQQGQAGELVHEQEEAGALQQLGLHRLAGADQGIAVGVGGASGGGGPRGQGQGGIGLDQLDGRRRLAQDLAGDLGEGAGVALAHVGDGVIDAEGPGGGQLDLGDGGIRQAAAIAHGVEDRGDPDPAPLEGRGRGLPGATLPPEGLAAQGLQTGDQAGGVDLGHPGAIAIPPPQGILAAQVQGVPAQGRGQPVHHALEGEAGLADAETAHGPADGMVGIDRPAAHAGVGDAVGAAGVLQPQFHDLAAQVGVGAGVVVELAVEGVEGAVGQGAQAVAQPRRVALVAGDHGLLALPDHLHRPAPGVEGRQRQQTLHRGPVLATKTAAQVGADDPDAQHVQPQGVGDLEAVAEGGLGGDGEGQDPIRQQLRHAVLGLQEGVVLEGEVKLPLDDDGAVRPGRVDLPGDDLRRQQAIAPLMK